MQWVFFCLLKLLADKVNFPTNVLVKFKQRRLSIHHIHTIANYLGICTYMSEYKLRYCDGVAIKLSRTFKRILWRKKKVFVTCWTMLVQVLFKMEYWLTIKAEKTHLFHKGIMTVQLTSAFTLILLLCILWIKYRLTWLVLMQYLMELYFYLNLKGRWNWHFKFSAKIAQTPGVSAPQSFYTYPP